MVNYISIWGTSIYGDLQIPKAQILWTFQGEKQLGPHPGVKASRATAQTQMTRGDILWAICMECMGEFMATLWGISIINIHLFDGCKLKFAWFWENDNSSK